MDRYAERRGFVYRSSLTVVEVRRKRVFDAMMTGQRVVLDLHYQELMNATVVQCHIMNV